MLPDAAPRFPGLAAIERLYAGSRSAVYRARREADDRPVILKVARAGQIGTDEALARLRHERDLLTSVHSERVIRAFDVAQFGDDAVLILEDVGGDSLDRHLGRARFSLAETLEIAIGIAAALRDIHAAGIIHKDVTPSNIVYNPATRDVRLIDFDIASAWRTDHHGFVSPRTLEGTLRYMAPEQTGRMNRATDSRADLYAFGATLFELLTGRLPFLDTDILSIVHAHLAVRPPSPDAIDPAIPAPVSAIVTKLLAKAPEDRYQTADGVLADLQTAAEQLARTGAIVEFALARADVTRQFELPTRLYGRATELGTLTDAFERTAGGAVETVLVAGRSGVGKTSIVRELFPVVTRARGYFLSGKFDQLRGDAPYPALVAALTELIDHLLTETEDGLAGWRERITSAIAPNGQVVIDAIPALERVIGPQPAVVALDAAATQSRFLLAIQKFLQVFTRRAHPVVLFLDDMQWADPASIHLLKLVAMSHGTEALLVIAAFRDHEVSEAHPLLAAAREIGKQRGVTRLDIVALPTSEIAAFVADTLRRDIADIAPLVRLVCRKTDGNPLFVRQLLLALHAAAHLRFDPALRGFAFDAAAIEHAPISENVADLLAENLRKLPAATRRILALAASIGNRFDIDLLARLAGTSPAAVHAELESALIQELVVPLSELEYVAAPTGAGLVFRRLRFQHDRIQHAAYAVLSVDDQQRTHLRIGELLRVGASPSELADRTFDVVSHFNRALPLIDAGDPAIGRVELARLNVAAGRKARGSAAYAAAIDCMQIAVDRLDWATEYHEQLEAHVMLAECRYLGGEVKRALAVLDLAESHAVHACDRGALTALRATLYIYANDLRSAIHCTRRAAALLGRAVPDDRGALVTGIAATIAEIVAAIDERPIEDLVALPEMTDPGSLQLMVLFNNCMPAAFQCEPVLGAYVTAQMVLLSLERGNCPVSAHAYCAFSRVIRDTELHRVAYRFGKLGFALNRRLDDRAQRPTVDFVFALFSGPWLEPIEHTIASLREAARLGRDVGDPIHAGYSAAHEIAYRAFWGAESLDDIARDARMYRQQCGELDDAPSARYLSWQIERLRALIDETEAPGAGAANPPGAGIRDEASPAHQFNFLAIRVEVTYLLGDPRTALHLARITRAVELDAPNLLLVSEHRFYHCLAALAVCRDEPALWDELQPVIDANLRDLQRSAEACPANFEARALLVQAEREALRGEIAATMALYDRALASAARHAMRLIEALVHERYSQFWRDRDKPDFALVSLVRARNLYAAIGAQRKVRMIESAHPALVRAGAQLGLSSTITTVAATEVLDFTAIARATRAISGELELNKLLETMLAIIFENAGAEGGALVLDTAHGLAVAVSRTGGAPRISTISTPLGAAALPRSLVHYVHRTGAVVVIDDAASDPRFGNDDYIRSREPRSVLCLPIKHKDRIIGSLYLENTLVSGAFTQARLDALMILVSQIAVSLENATLFAAQRVQAEAISRANDELRSEITVREQAERELARYQTQLEELIAERTRELTLANQKLRDAAAERERIEAELRLAQKLESVGRLAAGIAHEINTPIQFVSNCINFVQDTLPGLLETVGKYRELASAIDAQRDVARPIADAAAVARATERDADIDYVLEHVPGALDSVRGGLDRVAIIVRSMKDFAYPDREDKTLVDLNRAIENTLTIAAHECKYIADVHTELAELPLVRCNGGEINQAVLNLVINAAHAIRDVVGDTGQRGKILVTTRHDGDAMEIAVGDTGTGIPPEVRDKIYDPFFTTKEVGRGTGQGLAVVRSVVVDKHHGSLRFETETGRGTTFFIRLPVDDSRLSSDSDG